MIWQSHSTVPSKQQDYETLIYEAFRLRDLQSLCFSFANAHAMRGSLSYQKTIEVQEVGVKATRTKMDVLTEIFMSMEKIKGILQESTLVLRT
ncbi:hypothetical protein ACEQPO_09660 [Bacillus sp. SL00103]